MKKLFYKAVMILACAGAMLAQDRVQRVITIKNGNLGAIFRTVKELMQGSSVVASQDNDHIVLSGTKEAVAGFEEIIKQLDVPLSKLNVEVTVYMITASAQTGASNLPPGLDPVVAQLKNVFTYKSFHLLDSFILRSRSGDHGETSGFLPAAGPNVPANTKTTYQFRYNRVTVDGGNEHLIRLDGLRLSLQMPIADSKGQFMFKEASIFTDVDVPEGKKVVVGKTTAEGADSALFLVISAKVVD